MHHKIIAVISTIVMAGCSVSYSQPWQHKVHIPTKQEQQADSFVSLVLFMHKYKHVSRPSKRMIDEMNAYIHHAGMIRECNPKCYLKYNNNKIFITPENIKVITKFGEITVTTADEAVKYIYN
jgi:hypothetical protein